jgi:hypothetical protein
MSNINTLPSDRVAVAAVVTPGALTAGAKNSGWVSLVLYKRLMAVISTGTLGTAATIDAKWQIADDSSGTNPVDANTTALTQIVKATGDNKQAVMNFNADQLTTRTKPWARLVLTVAVATSDAGAIVLGFDPRHAPAIDNDPATVVQVVS